MGRARSPGGYRVEGMAVRRSRVIQIEWHSARSAANDELPARVAAAAISTIH
jgi:hypothetical protein